MQLIIKREELQELVDEILEFKKEGAERFWLIGERLNQIKDKKLWYPDFNTFGDFLLQAIKFHPNTANNLMDLNRKFQITDAVRLSWHKLHLIKDIPPEKRDSLLSRAGTMTEKEIKTEIMEAKLEKSPLKEEVRNYYLDIFDKLKVLKEDSNEIKHFKTGLEISKAKQESFELFAYKNQILQLIKEVKEIWNEI